MDSTLMFILQGALGIIMLFFGFILNGMRTSVDRVAADLKNLNDAVLGKYITRDENDAKWTAQRTLDHEMRNLITAAMIKIAEIPGQKWDHGDISKERNKS